MLNHLVDVSIRSVALAVVAGAVLAVSGRRRTAALQHAVWTAVLCGMLALFMFGATLPKLHLRVISAEEVSMHVTAVEPASIELQRRPSEATRTVAAQPSQPTANWIQIALIAYVAVAVALLARLLTGLILIRRLIARSAPAGDFFESELVSVPFTIGWLRPRIVLPMNWREWGADKLTAVLAHESAHVRRRDGLFALLAGINRCAFWFHPLAWFLERKLALLAEEACDEACVAELGDRDAYARLLVEMASVMDGSQKRLQYHALTMAAPTHLRRRVDSLLEEGRTFSRGLSRAAGIAIAACGVPLLLVAGAVDLSKQPAALRMELPRWSTPQPPASALIRNEPVLMAQATAPQQEAALPLAAAKFDSASIKRCGEGDGAGRGGRGGAGGRGFVAEPGSYFVHCMSLQGMLDFAQSEMRVKLVNDARGMPEFPGRIRGGPAWVNTELYTIDARTSAPAANAPQERNGAAWTAAMRLMGGPMLLSLLQDRFSLKFRRDVEQIPMYALTVAPGGPKLKPAGDEDCVPIGNGRFPYPGGFKFGRDPKPPCNWVGWSADGPNRTFEGGAIPMSRFAEIGDLFLDRHVVDQTGITGTFNIHLEYLPDEHATPKMPLLADEQVDPNSNVPRAPGIFRAVEEQLGLRLSSTTGPHGYIVIESAERPTLD